MIKTSKIKILRDVVMLLHLTTRENPSSSAGFEAISSAGSRATNKALQLTVNSSAVCTLATTIDYISSAFPERATIN